MIEELKSLIEMIEKVPETALWILGGFALYKLLTFASVVAAFTKITTLAINKIHDIKTKPKVVEYQLDDVTVGTEAAIKLKELVKTLAMKLNANNVSRSYRSSLYPSDVAWLEAAIRAKWDAENK